MPRKRTAPIVYPLIMSHVREHPGQTPKAIYAALSKTVPELKTISFSAFSGGISNMVNTGRLYYRPHERTDEDKSLYTLYFKTTRMSPRVMSGHKKRRFRMSRANGVDVGAEALPITPAGKPRAVAKGDMVDVQLLIAIGDKDTMIGFEAARNLYEKLRVIFEGA